MGEGRQLRRGQPESLELGRRSIPLEVAVRDRVGIGAEYSLLLAHGLRERRGRLLCDEERDADVEVAVGARRKRDFHEPTGLDPRLGVAGKAERVERRLGVDGVRRTGPGQQQRHERA